jgi:NitT/TauT family transport system permease protein
MRKFIRKYWITAVVIAALVGIYVVTTEAGVANSFLFPKVEAIGAAFSQNGQLMISNMFFSFSLIIPAIAISLLIALAIGTLLGLNKRLRDALHPIIYIFSVIPAILLSPFALLLSPSFTVASIFLIVYGTVWSTLFATITGIMTIDKRYLDKAKTLNLTGIKLVFRVILPAASPSIIAGFVNSLRSSFVMLVFAEMYGAQQGMGFFVKKYAEFGIYANTWAGVIFMAFVLVIVMQLFEKLKTYLLRWTI